jgi:hypothetical protein
MMTSVPSIFNPRSESDAEASSTTTIFTSTYPLMNFTSPSVVRTTPRNASDLFFRALPSTNVSVSWLSPSTPMNTKGNTLFLQTFASGLLVFHTVPRKVTKAGAQRSTGSTIQYHVTFTCMTDAKASPLGCAPLAEYAASRKVLERAFAKRSRPQETRLSLCASAQPVKLPFQRAATMSLFVWLTKLDWNKFTKPAGFS